VLGPQRQVVVAREVTKLYEEFVRGTAAEVLAEFTRRKEIRGEITLLIGRHEEPAHGVVQEAEQGAAGAAAASKAGAGVSRSAAGAASGALQAAAGVPIVVLKNARTRVRELMKSEGLDEKEAMKRVAKEMGVSKSHVYRQMQKDGKK
jgi:16S rRNA (cytidine1402-2'-O)-methyltransferase